MSRLSLIFKMCAGPENGGGDRGNEAQDPYLRAEMRLYQDIVKARTKDIEKENISD